MSDATKPEFLGDNYLLENESARNLFATVHDLPIVDAHNHADIVEIVDNQPWPDIWVLSRRSRRWY